MAKTTVKTMTKKTAKTTTMTTITTIKTRMTRTKETTRTTIMMMTTMKRAFGFGARTQSRPFEMFMRMSLTEISNDSRMLEGTRLDSQETLNSFVRRTLGKLRKLNHGYPGNNGNHRSVKCEMEIAAAGVHKEEAVLTHGSPTVAPILAPHNARLVFHTLVRHVGGRDVVADGRGGASRAV